MKQTVTILTAMMVALLLVSGFVLMGSIQQSEKLMAREDQLLKQSGELDEKSLLIAQLEKEAEERTQQTQQLTKERDALSQQLNDAVLSSQESNDALARQTQEKQRLQMEKEQLAKQLLNERKQLQEMRSQLAALQQEAISTAVCEGTPAPTAFRVERRIK